MCGICGVYESGKDNRELVTRMHALIAHRGPDSAAVYHSGNVTLGHRRLSIIDLSTGDQPIFNDDRSMAIVYNGEIYNFPELRKSLMDRGCRFYTQSDTEVILKLYETEGVESFARLNGIFAFAILDERHGSQKLVLARDHFGIKPLHYWAQNRRFVFASEQKAILLHPNVTREVNPQTLHIHLNLRYTQSQETLFKGIYRLPPAHYMIVEDGEVKELKRFWKLSYEIDYTKSAADWAAEIPHYIRQAVKRQLISDVPIGVYLSGGMDSSSIVAMMREVGVSELNTFTLGFNEPTDELSDAALVAQHYTTRHHTLNMEMNPMRFLPEVIWHAEEPKINLLQGFMMSRFVSQHVKVVLGGLGGDELFSGYDIHNIIYPFNLLHRLVPPFIEQHLFSPISRVVYAMQRRFGTFASDEYRRGLQMALATGNIAKFYLILRNVWDLDQQAWRDIYQPGFLQQHHLKPVMSEFEPLFDLSNELTPLDKVYWAELNSKMVNDYLLTEDRMSMANSIEERVPFLDLDLVKFAFQIPAKHKMRLGETKALLRRAMKPYLPEKILRKKKWGFTFNPYLQYQKDLKQTAQQILTKERIEQDGVFNYAFIRKIFDTPPHPRMRWHYNFIWVLTGYYIWKSMFIESNAFAERQVAAEAYLE